MASRQVRGLLAGLDDAESRRRIATALTATKARSWYVLRRIHGLSVEEKVTSMEEMVSGLRGTGDFNRRSGGAIPSRRE